jgi:hypothetical protein
MRVDEIGSISLRITKFQKKKERREQRRSLHILKHIPNPLVAYIQK